MEARLTGIDREEVLAYLGSGDTQELSSGISAAWARLRPAVTPRLTYRVWERNDQQLEGLLQGEDIRSLLAQSHHVVIFAATLGAGVDTLLARLQILDMGQALVLDACASSAIENVCDNFCIDMAEKHGHLTDRFSPGYGDFPLEVQHELAAALDLPRTIGVGLTDSGLMVPMKSVTAIFGIAHTPQPARVRGCVHCYLYENCQLRKENRRCGTK